MQPLRGGQPDRAPVVHHQREAVDARVRRGTPRGSGRSRRSSSRSRPAWPSARSRAGRARRRRCARGRAASRRSWWARRARRAPAPRRRRARPGARRPRPRPPAPCARRSLPSGAASWRTRRRQVARSRRDGHGSARRRGGCARSSSAWRPSTAARRPRPHRAPIDELVLTVLSQNTNDRNRDVAYERLRERFESLGRGARRARRRRWWRRSGPGGLAATKAPRIQEILRAIGDDDLSRLARRAARRRRARELCALPGRGAQDGGLRAAVLLRPPRRAGGHPRVPGGHAARACSGPARRSRRRTTRCCAWRAARTRTRRTWR